MKKDPGKGLFSYVRPERIELSTKPWQGLIIPLNHGRNINFSALSQAK